MTSYSHRQTDRYVVDTKNIDMGLLALHLQSRQMASTLRTAKTGSSSNPSTAILRTELKVDEFYLSRLESKERNLIGRTSVSRAIPTQAERVLDAPGFVDDYYLNNLAWSSRNILAVALGPSVYLWNGEDSSVKELLTLPDAADATSPYVSSVGWIRDGKSMAVGTADGTVQIWDVEKGRKLRTMIASLGSRVSSLDWNRHLLSTGSRNGSVLTHDVRIAKHLTCTHETVSKGEVCGLTWSLDGDRLASGSNDNFVHIWDFASPDRGQVAAACPTAVLEGHTSAVKALAWCPWKPDVLATGGGSQDKTIRLWDVTSGECLTSINTGSAVSSLLWSRHTEEIVAAHGYDRNHLSIWKSNSSARSLGLVGNIEKAHDSRILAMCPSPDGRTVATASGDESIKFWSIFPCSLTEEPLKGKTSKSVLPPPKPQYASRSPFSLRTRNFV